MRRRDLFRPRPRDDLRQRDEPDVSWLEVVVLGLVQGLTEFLPISSSAHLRIVSGVFFGNDAGAAFTAVTQLGTEAAVLIYFARDIGRLTMAWVRGLARREARAELRLPAGLAGDPRHDADRRARAGCSRTRSRPRRATCGSSRRRWSSSACCWGWPSGSGRQKVDLERMTVAAGPHPGVRAGDGADPGRVAVRRHDHRGPLPRAHPARGRPLLVPAGHPGRRRVRAVPAARRPHARRTRAACRWSWPR